MESITLESLLSTGAHFGHLTRKWHPKMNPFIFMEKNGIHIVDLKKTLDCIDNAAKMIKNTVSDGGTVLFVGTKKQAKTAVEEEALRCGEYYIVERWLGGTLTNFATIKRSIRRLNQLEKESENPDAWIGLTKKEKLTLLREKERLQILHRGIKEMKKLPDLLYVVEAMKEDIAVSEANKLDIPVIAIIDTNTDPTPIDYPIPANDDSIRTIGLITRYIADVIMEAKGKDIFPENSQQETVTEEGRT
jgi:small subunit ribosomal protein S2